VGAKHALKAALLPAGPAPRTILAGIARGVRMNIDFADQARMYLGLYERELARPMRSVLQRGVASFDVGAQFGYDSLAFAKHTGAQVAAFEYLAECVTQMRANFALNPSLAPLITPVEGTVGDRPGRLRLDDWAFGDHGFVPGFIKLDVEGDEVDVLRSAERILVEARPALVVEVHSLRLEDECLAILGMHSYSMRIVPQRRVCRDHRVIGHNRWITTA